MELIEVGGKKKIPKKFVSVSIISRGAGNGRCKDLEVEGGIMDGTTAVNSM